MSNFLDLARLAKLLGVDPVYLGSVITRHGLRVLQDGSVDLSEVLQLLAQSGAVSGILESAPKLNLAPVPEPEPEPEPELGFESESEPELAPESAPVSELSSVEADITARRRSHPVQRAASHDLVFTVLKDHGIEVCWEQQKHPRSNWLLLGRSATYRAYLSVRRLTPMIDYVNVGVTQEEAFDFLMVWCSRGKPIGSPIGKSRRGVAGVLLYTKDELRKMQTAGKSQGRDWFRLPLASQYKIDRRLQLLDDK